MDLRLREVARTGNIGDLYALIQEDPYILERIDQIPFVDTPFHIAALEGQINFAMEMMNLKPSFARKLNQDGFSPMHLALSNGHTKLVLRLLKTDKDLVRVKGREGMTPFHYAVIMGNSNLLVEFLEACPERIEDVTVQGETALHLALKNEQMEAFHVMIGWLQRNCRRSARDLETNIANWRDNDDNTVLHVAARKEQHQALKLLLDSFLWLDVKAKNSEGLTALDIVRNVERNLSNEQYSSNDAKIKHLKTKVKSSERRFTVIARAKNSTSMEMINALLVITALVITATYQSSLSPPGGVWQGDNSSSTTTSNAAHRHLLGHNSYNQSTWKRLFGEESRKAGTTIMSPNTYFTFWLLNCVTFVVSIVLTTFLVSSVPLFGFLFTPFYYCIISYFYSMKIISPSATWSNINFVFMFIFACLPYTVPFFIMDYSREIKGDQKDRTYLLQVLDGDNNNGFIQRLQRTIKFILRT